MDFPGCECGWGQTQPVLGAKGVQTGPSLAWRLGYGHGNHLSHRVFLPRILFFTLTSSKIDLILLLYSSMNFKHMCRFM